MKAKTILLSFLVLSIIFLGLSVFATAQSSGGGGGGSGAKIFYIDDTFEITYTDGVDTYQAGYKVWKIEEKDGKNVTTLLLNPGGGISISNAYEGKEISLSNIGNIIFSKVYISGNEKYIAISLENAGFKNSSDAPPSSGSGSNGGGNGTTTTTCTDSDGGKEYYEYGEIIVGTSTSTGGGASMSADSCRNIYILREKFCDGNSGSYVEYECPGGCEDGVCLGSEGSGDGGPGNGYPTNYTNSSVGGSGSGPGEGQPSNSSSSGGSGGGGSLSQCSTGCNLNGSCVAFGYRINNTYCDLNKNFIQQKEASQVCENDFECSSNLCIDGSCIDSGLWKKILSWFKNLFG